MKADEPKSHHVAQPPTDQDVVSECAAKMINSFYNYRDAKSVKWCSELTEWPSWLAAANLGLRYYDEWHRKKANDICKVLYSDEQSLVQRVHINASARLLGQQGETR
jgi:hypothetical protein